MKRLALLVLLAVTAPAAAQTVTPDPPKVTARLDGHDREIKALKSRLAALEAKPAAPLVAAPKAVPDAAVANLYGSDDATYRSTRRLVESGRRVTLFVGVPALEYTSRDVSVARVDSLPGFAPGVYDCFRGADGRAMFEARTPPAAFATPVRNLIYRFAPRGCANGQCPK